MKKYVFVLALIFLFFLVYFVWNFSFGTTQKYNLCSQIEKYIFYAKAEKYEAVLKVGERESCFDYDGISNKKTNYALLEITPFVYNENVKSLQLIIYIGNKRKNITLVKNPFKRSFLIDLETNIKKNEKILIWVEKVDSEKFLKLENISLNFSTSYKKAINLGFLAYEKFIKNNTKYNNSCEIFISVEKNQEKGIYFWKFFVVTSKKQTKTALIGTNEQDILIMT